ncbi:glycosyltransferase family 2 protein [Arthrospiribacter ruber]|uniref:Glycosyltransferase family 2 protein n=2 Tax=Arthrospiribacter ruber TaxID=2487934 RepID=A0A951IW82_9BACT|nr:glycosyltransferase family 2 protein [Arthrospiribacter ruber]
MPVYNGERYLKDAISSVLIQSFKNFELLIIDDGSSDQSLKIIEGINDSRIRIIRNNENKGIAFVRNLGLNQAKGKYLVWMDCDDIIHKDKFQKQIDYLESNSEVGICGTWLWRFGDGKQAIAKSPNDPEVVKTTLIFSPSVWNATAMFRLSFIRKANLNYDTRLAIAEDYNFYLDASFHFPIHNIPEPLYYYRASETSIMKEYESQESKKKSFYKIIYTKVFDKLGIINDDRNFNVHYKIASNHLIDDYSEYQEVYEWLVFLKKKNMEMNIYNHDSFSIMIDNMFYFVSKKSSKIGFTVFAFFMKNVSSLKNIESILLLKLLTRCIVKYDKF